MVCFVFEDFVKITAVYPLAARSTPNEMLEIFRLRFFVCFLAHGSNKSVLAMAGFTCRLIRCVRSAVPDLCVLLPNKDQCNSKSIQALRLAPRLLTPPPHSR